MTAQGTLPCVSVISPKQGCSTSDRLMCFPIYEKIERHLDFIVYPPYRNHLSSSRRVESCIVEAFAFVVNQVVVLTVSHCIGVGLRKFVTHGFVTSSVATFVFKIKCGKRFRNPIDSRRFDRHSSCLLHALLREQLNKPKWVVVWEDF